MVAFERAEERVLIDDLAPRDVDQHAAALHRREAVLVEQASRLRGPLTANCDEIALRQKPVESLRPADFAEALRQGRTGLRLTAGADNTHAERGAEPADFGSDPAGPNNAHSLALYEKRLIGAMVERTGFAVNCRPVEAHREVQN